MHTNQEIHISFLFQDIIRFTLILGIFIVGFLVALHNLYWYFSPDIINDSFIPSQKEYEAALASAGVVNFGGLVSFP